LPICFQPATSLRIGLVADGECDAQLYEVPRGGLTLPAAGWQFVASCLRGPIPRRGLTRVFAVFEIVAEYGSWIFGFLRSAAPDANYRSEGSDAGQRQESQ
jgi:hypothetical protein